MHSGFDVEKFLSTLCTVVDLTWKCASPPLICRDTVGNVTKSQSPLKHYYLTTLSLLSFFATSPLIRRDTFSKCGKVSKSPQSLLTHYYLTTFLLCHINLFAAYLAMWEKSYFPDFHTTMLRLILSVSLSPLLPLSISSLSWKVVFSRLSYHSATTSQ